MHFNPRPRKEGDIRVWQMVAHSHNFNPRPRKEGDKSIINIDMMIITISIHALAKRATRFWNKTPKNHYHFNPRPRKEGDFKKLI